MKIVVCVFCAVLMASGVRADTPNSVGAWKGTYTGLFSDTNLVHETAGLFTATVTSSGAFTAKLQSGATKGTVRGAFDASGHATITVLQRKVPVFNAELQIDTTPGADRLTGTVSGGTWTVNVTAARAVFNARTNPCPYATNYTVVIPGVPDSEDGPQGHSFGTVVVTRAGSLRVVGSLADGSPFSQTANVSKTGEWPLFVALYGGRGSLLGRPSFSSQHTVDGLVHWTKPAIANQPLYPGGFTNDAVVSGSAYAPASPALTIADGIATLDSASLLTPLTNAVLFTSKNKIISTTAGNLGFAITKGSGGFFGIAVTPGAGTKGVAHCKGVVLQSENAGFGYFPDGRRSGAIWFGPIPTVYPPVLARATILHAGLRTDSVLLADLDGDGRLDIIAGNTSTNTISIFRNTTTPGSQTNISFDARVDLFRNAPVLPGSTAAFVSAGDLNGDGRLDLAVADVESNTVSIFQNNITNTPISTNSFGPRIDLPTGPCPVCTAIADLDGDDHPDLITVNYCNAGSVSVFRNISTNNAPLQASSFAPRFDLPTLVGPVFVLVADLDHDGKLDLIVANSGTSLISIYQNVSTPGSLGTNSFLAPVNLVSGNGPYAVRARDLNADGSLDLVVPNAFSASVSVFQSMITNPTTMTTNSFGKSVDFPVGLNPYNAETIDLDGNGRPDLITANWANFSLSLLTNSIGTGVISTNSFGLRTTVNADSQPLGLAVGDINKDGKPDVVVGDSTTDQVSVYINRSP